MKEYLPQTFTSRRPAVVWLVLAFGALSVFAMVIGAPLAQSRNHTFVALIIYQAFGKLCHQIPERSFFIAGHQYAVCARCTGLYAGFTLALLLYPLLKSLRDTTTPPRKWLFLAAAPMAVDLGLRLLGIWENTHSSRFATGALLGAVAVFYVMPGVVELVLRAWPLSRRPFSEPASFAASPQSISTALSDYSAPHRRI